VSGSEDVHGLSSCWGAIDEYSVAALRCAVRLAIEGLTRPCDLVAGPRFARKLFEHLEVKRQDLKRQVKRRYINAQSHPDHTLCPCLPWSLVEWSGSTYSTVTRCIDVDSAV
jgi:hypothetical protein